MAKIEKRIRMRIVEFKSIYKPPHKGWCRPEIAEGTTMYAISYVCGGYFTYSYLRREDAQRVMQTMIYEGTDTDQYYHFNVVKDIQRTIQAGVKQ